MVIEKAKNEEMRDELTHWLKSVLRPWFSERILPIDEDVILLWRQIVEKGRKQGYTYSQPDLFIAAIAIVNDLCVVTRNTKDFEKASVAVINPFDGSIQRSGPS